MSGGLAEESAAPSGEGAMSDPTIRIPPDPVVQVECVVCHRTKAPLGRSVALAMAGSRCDSDCEGYYLAPQPDCRWPGERVCGPGCTRGGDDE